MLSDLLIQYLVPVLKTHPSLATVFAVLCVVVAAWARCPESWKAVLHAWNPLGTKLGIRLAGVLDMLVGLLPTAPKVADAFIKGVLQAHVKPTVESVLAAASIPPGTPPTNASER